MADNVRHLRPPWKPGQSGNPAGRPSQVLELARYIAERTNNGRDLVDQCLLALSDPDAFAARNLPADAPPEFAQYAKGLTDNERAGIRKFALLELFNRYAGKATQTIKLEREGPANVTLDISRLTDAQLKAYGEAIAAGVVPRE